MATNELPYSIDEARSHLSRVDAVLRGVIERAGPFNLVPRADPYASLVRTILFQQLAGPAAMAIQRRWLALYGREPDDGPPAPAAVIATTEEQFRATGVSRQKSAYLRDLAEHALEGDLEGDLDFAALPALSDAEVIERITAVKGLGEWSAHMFLMFHLGRPDVLPVGDLGVAPGDAPRLWATGDADAGAGAGDRRALGALSLRRLLVHVARRRAHRAEYLAGVTRSDQL